MEPHLRCLFSLLAMIARVSGGGANKRRIKTPGTAAAARRPHGWLSPAEHAPGAARLIVWTISVGASAQDMPTIRIFIPLEIT